jgi:DNA-binding MarR family transcriptional regulator
MLLVILNSDTASCQVRTIADNLGMSIPRVSMIGMTLEKQGLISRCVPASDLRKVALALEAPGYEAARKHLSNLQGIFEMAGS